MITLYLKTHNITGLKYLGKTEQNVYEYKGSGVYWKNHLKKHGNDVTTKILFQSEDMDKIKAKGLELSEMYNIVESKEFANLMEENGIGGVTSTSFKKGMTPANKGKKMSAEVCEKLKRSARKRWDKWKEDNPDFEYKTYQKASPERLVEMYADRAKRIAERNKAKVICPHCNKEGNIANMKRWHFDNCKMKKP